MRTRALRDIAALALAGLGVLPAGPAAAHHVMDNQLPTSLAQGLLSGLGHPVIGLDHLAAILAVGGLAALHRNGAPLVLAYVAAMLGGTSTHVAGAAIPASEALVALSVIVLGALLVLARAPTSRGLSAIFVAAGLLHGYAMGESIIGAEITPLAAYFVGLGIVQAGLGIGAMLLTRVSALPAGSAPLRLAGTAVVLVGVAVLGLAVGLLPAA